MGEGTPEPGAHDGDDDAVATARDGFVAGANFARWHREQDMRTMVGVLLGHQQPQSVRDFFDGFLSGAEAEHRRRGDTQSGSDALPFKVEWT